MTLNLKDMTVSIVEAYVGNNKITADEVLLMIKQVHQTLSTLENDEIPCFKETYPFTEEEFKPIIPVAESVKNDSISCLICGKEYKTLKRHLKASHNITPEDYKERFSLEKDYPLVAHSYSKRRREIALDIYLGRVEE